MFGEDNNMMHENTPQMTESRVAVYVAKVMGWMCVGLLTTLVVSMLCLAIPNISYMLRVSNVQYFIMIAQLVVVLAMSFGMNRVSPGVATVMFMTYAALTGVTFSVLFYLFMLSSLIGVFALTFIIFAAMAVYGFLTKRDLTKIGTLAIFGLFGIIIAGIANWFMRSSMLDFIVCCIGVVIFIVLIAYDTQKIKAIYSDALARGFDEEHPEVRKLAIFGALTLYLDFINLFLKLLRLLGRRRN